MSNYAKLWAQKRLNQASIQRANEAIHMTGRALPCQVTAISGAMVTVSFLVQQQKYALPSITIPKQESNWIRNPTQVGDMGITMPADVYVGIASGQTNVLPDMSIQPSNLSALIFVPISSKTSPPVNQNAAIVQGPDGAIVQTTTGTASSVITNTSGTTVTYGSNTLVVNSTGITGTVGSSSIAITSNSITLSAGGQTFELSSAGIVMNGLNFGTHYHTGVTTGTGNSGGPA